MKRAAKDVINESEKKMSTLENVLLTSLSMKEHEQSMAHNSTTLIRPMEPNLFIQTSMFEENKEFIGADDGLWDDGFNEKNFPTPTPTPPASAAKKKGKGAKKAVPIEKRKYPEKYTPQLFMPCGETEDD